jgi:hypothetical protein
LARTHEGLRIRSFREGDEQVLCRLFNGYLAAFFGPIRLGPPEWREQFKQQTWTGPSLTDDRDACRIAERDGRILGYAITDYQPNMQDGAAVLQELCAVEEHDAQRVAEALIADAEERALQRGKFVLVLQLSAEDGLSSAAAEARGFDNQLDDGGVFMGSISNLRGFLAEMAPALSSRLARSDFAGWRGTLSISSGKQSAGLDIEGSAVHARTPFAKPDIRLAARPDALALLLFGRESVGALYLQDALSVDAEDRRTALRLLDALFPRIPAFLPRAQWW